MIIAIFGKAGSGKSTLAQMFSIQLDADIMPIASSLKEIATSSFNWDGKKDARGRKLLQDIGDVGRWYNPDIWLDKWLESCNIKEAGGLGLEDVIVIDDIRIINELSYITNSFPGETICIKITGRQAYDDNDKEAQHSTERDIPDEAFDHIIDNSGPVQELYNFMMEIINSEKDRFITKTGES